MNGTPSWLFGTCSPCQCTAVLCGSSLVTLMRTLSPSVTRISGPGVTPLYVHASTRLPGVTSHCTTWQTRSKTLTSPSIVNSSGWPPNPSVAAGKAFTPASCIASISSAVGSSSDCAAGAACGIRAPSCACPESAAALAIPPSILTAGATAVPIAPMPKVARRPIAPRRVTEPITSLIISSVSLSISRAVGIPDQDPDRVEVSVLSVLRAEIAHRTVLLYQFSAKKGSTLPRGTEGRLQPAIEAPEPGNFPGQHQEDGESEENGVAGGGPGQHEAEVHDRAEEGGDANKSADQQSQSDEHLTPGDQLSEPGVPAVVEHVLQELAEPVVGNGGPSLLRDRGRPLPVRLQRGAALRPLGIGDLVPASREPVASHEEAHRQPQECKEDVAQQQPPTNRVLNLAASLGRAGLP